MKDFLCFKMECIYEDFLYYNLLVRFDVMNRDFNNGELIINNFLYDFYRVFW